VATMFGVYRSTNDGQSWHQVGVIKRSTALWGVRSKDC
jgi:hypothetical protein